MQTHRYGLTVKTPLGFDEATAAIREALQAEGFGVLTEIDVQATLKKKLDVDRAPYVILGACNPVLANQAIGAEPEIGLLLPCNVIVYVEDGATIVSAVDPIAMFSLIDRPDLCAVAEDAAARLRRALESLPMNSH